MLCDAYRVKIPYRCVNPTGLRSTADGTSAHFWLAALAWSSRARARSARERVSLRVRVSRTPGVMIMMIMIQILIVVIVIIIIITTTRPQGPRNSSVTDRRGVSTRGAPAEAMRSDRVGEQGTPWHVRVNRCKVNGSTQKSLRQKI